jgi:YD repeat-containing protein
VVSATDANGGTTSYSFDHFGFLAKVQDALGNATHFSYDDHFNLYPVYRLAAP